MLLRENASQVTVYEGHVQGLFDTRVNCLSMYLVLIFFLLFATVLTPEREYQRNISAWNVEFEKF